MTTPETARLVRALDAALSLSGYRPHAAVVGADALAAWRAAGPLVQARTLLFLAQRTGPTDEVHALAAVSAALGVDLATAPPSPVLAAVGALEDHADPRAVVRAALEVAARVYVLDAPQCPFCRIADEADPAVQVIDRRDDTVAVVPRDPATGRTGGVAPGHWLVIPRVHVPDALAVPEVTAQVMHHAADLAREQGPAAVNLVASVGAAATATVDHLHAHLVPREMGDGLPLPWDPYGLQGRLVPDALAAVGDPVADEAPGVQRAPQDALVAYARTAHDMDADEAARFVAWLWPRREAVSPTGRTTWAVLVSDALEVWRNRRPGGVPAR